MKAKNRRFNVAGAGIHRNKASQGELVYFELDSDNVHDKDAIKVVSQDELTLGYIPQEIAKEIQVFMKGKYPFYCAKVIDIWKPDDADFFVPKILAHFANKPIELPYQQQEWKKKRAASDILRNRTIFGGSLGVIFILWIVLLNTMSGFLLPTILCAILTWIVITLLVNLG